MLGAVIFYAIPVAYILFVGFRPPAEMSVRKWGAAYGLEVTATNRDFVSTYLRRSKRIRRQNEAMRMSKRVNVGSSHSMSLLP